MRVARKVRSVVPVSVLRVGRERAAAHGLTSRTVYKVMHFSAWLHHQKLRE
jgi:hypothetical protein